MCGVCGCGEDEVRIDRATAGHHHHRHESGPHHHHTQSLDHAHPVETGAGRLLRIEQDILAKNDGFAAGNRERLNKAGVLALNLVSGPGAGKTTLLAATIAAMDQRMRVAVIEGDQATENDARRIRRAGAPAIQINTGRGCHLDAHMIAHALDGLTLERGDVLFIENVGNLVCPAAFDLGEHHKVALLSVTDGEDKPVKYPDMFAAADLMIINKIDLLPYVDFDLARCGEYARRVNPQIEVLPLSARQGDGMTAWLAWIEGVRRRSVAEAPHVTMVAAHA